MSRENSCPSRPSLQGRIVPGDLIERELIEELSRSHHAILDLRECEFDSIGVTDLFFIAESWSTKLAGSTVAILLPESSRHRMDFFATCCVNRSVAVQGFDDIGNALAWLREAA